LGAFVRAFIIGQVKQLDAVWSRFLFNLARKAPLFGDPTVAGVVFVDLDEAIIEAHGYAKQGSCYGYCGVPGLNAGLGTASREDRAPVILASARGQGPRSPPAARTSSSPQCWDPQAHGGAGAGGRSF
jgi:hypothetical protein